MLLLRRAAKDVEVAGKKLSLVWVEFGFLAHFGHPGAPFFLGVVGRIVGCMTADAFGSVELVGLSEFRG